MQFKKRDVLFNGNIFLFHPTLTRFIQNQTQFVQKKKQTHFFFEVSYATQVVLTLEQFVCFVLIRFIISFFFAVQFCLCARILSIKRSNGLATISSKCTFASLLCTIRVRVCSYANWAISKYSAHIAHFDRRIP